MVHEKKENTLPEHDVEETEKQELKILESAIGEDTPPIFCLHMPPDLEKQLAEAIRKINSEEE